MDWSLSGVFDVVALVLAVQYLGLPLAVFAQSKSPCRFKLADIPVEKLLAQAGDRFRGVHQTLLGLGFAPHLASEFANSNSNMRFVTYLRPGSATGATVAIGSSAVSELVSLEFGQQSSDGTILCLTNSSMPPIFPLWERKLVYRLPGESDVACMLKIFERVVAAQHGFVGREEPARLTDIERFMNDEIDYLVQKGFYQAKCRDGMRGMTIAAAYLASWKLFWPWKQLVLAREKRRTLEAAGA